LPQSAAINLDTGSAEWRVLIECAAANRWPSRLSALLREQLDWARLQGLADMHGMLPVLIARIPVSETKAPPEIALSLREQHRAQAALALALMAELFSLQDTFAQSGVHFLVTKGPVLSQRCYGDPGMRQYGDLDLIVFEKDLSRITELMIASGYEPRVPLKAIEAAKIPGEYVFRRPDTNLLVEFHTERTFRYHPRRLRLENLFARSVSVEMDGHAVPALCVEDELVLICIHSAKHFWERLMWVADVAALISREPGVNWGRALECAREVGGERMLRLGLRLASQMLEISLPVDIERNVCADRTALRVARQIAGRMPGADAEGLGLFQRALFRIRMRGDLLRGAAYLTRLALSPTEQDWAMGKEENRSWLRDALGRPLRLARKYGRPTKN
jgi:Uncharacterised nucleotidyltransferase